MILVNLTRILQEYIRFSQRLPLTSAVLRRLAGAPLGHGFAAFALVAVGAEQLQVVEMIGAAARLGQDVIDFHDLEGKMRLAAGAVAFLLAIEPMPMGAIVGQVAQVGAARRQVDHIGAAPERPAIFGDARVDQLDGQRRQVDAGPLTLQPIGRHQRGCAAAEGIEDDIAFVA